MYDNITTTISLTSDECDLIKIALERYQESLIGIGEVCTIECLLEKMEEQAV